MDSATFLDLSCTIKEIQFTGGQKQDIDVTTLCSTEQENINGLPSPSEISLSGNFYKNPAQDALRDAYDNDTTYAFRSFSRQGRALSSRLKSASIPVLRYQRRSGGNVFLRLKGKPENIESGS